MDKGQFEKFILENPDRKFCLHNGVAGFSYGSPSNPKWISNEKAWDILSNYERLTGINPIANYKTTWHINTLVFNKKAWTLRLKTFHKMIGFNTEKECLYEKEGLG